MINKLEVRRFELKILAFITMLLDHIGACLVSEGPTYYALRYIGRLSFPLYIFLLVEGFFKTSDRNKQLVRMGLLAIVSELPWDLVFNGKLEFQNQNIMFTLCLGYLAIYMIDTIQCRYSKNEEKKYIDIFLIVIVLSAVLLFATVLKADYGIWGVLAIVVTYYLFDSKMVSTTAMVITLSALDIEEMYGLLVIPLILRYNGKQGPKYKYLFYLLYPGHLLLIYLIMLFLR